MTALRAILARVRLWRLSWAMSRALAQRKAGRIQRQRSARMGVETRLSNERRARKGAPAR